MATRKSTTKTTQKLSLALDEVKAGDRIAINGSLYEVNRTESRMIDTETKVVNLYYLMDDNEELYSAFSDAEIDVERDE